MTNSTMNLDEPRSLYERLGGYDAIHAFAAAALRKAFSHPVIAHYWQQMSESSFHREHINFVDFLSAEWGGKAKYRGRDMITAHRGMGVTEAHWQAMFDCLYACYEDFNIPTELRVEINATFQKFKPHIVGSPSFRDVALAHPEMDITKGIASVGIQWP